MFTISDDGTFALPPGADEDFTRFLKRNGVPCLSVGQIQVPFNPARVQELYLSWVQRRERRIRRWTITLPSAALTVFFSFYCGLFLSLTQFDVPNPKPAGFGPTEIRELHVTSVDSITE